jgi:gas vesicle protein
VAKNGKRDKSGSGFFWGFIFGLLVGAALAVLFAPQPGAETREQLAEQSALLRKRGQLNYGDLAATLRERFGDAMVQGREAYARSKGEVLGRYNKAKSGE